MELGGFDITTEVDGTDEDTEDWDEEFPDENSSENVFSGESMPEDNAQNKAEKPDKSQSQDIVSEKEDVSGKIYETDRGGSWNPVPENADPPVRQSAAPAPVTTEEPALPTSETVCVSPTPVPTETLISTLPAEMENVRNTAEGYRIPPAECRQSMQVIFQKLYVMRGKHVKIVFDSRLVTDVLSVRADEQEIRWEKNGSDLELFVPEKYEISENGKCVLEMAFMVKEDLTWTQNKKNVILSYDLF